MFPNTFTNIYLIKHVYQRTINWRAHRQIFNVSINEDKISISTFVLFTFPWKQPTLNISFHNLDICYVTSSCQLCFPTWYPGIRLVTQFIAMIWIQVIHFAFKLFWLLMLNRTPFWFDWVGIWGALQGYSKI